MADHFNSSARSNKEVHASGVSTSSIRSAQASGPSHPVDMLTCIRVGEFFSTLKQAQARAQAAADAGLPNGSQNGAPDLAAAATRPSGRLDPNEFASLLPTSKFGNQSLNGSMTSQRMSSSKYGTSVSDGLDGRTTDSGTGMSKSNSDSNLDQSKSMDGGDPADNSDLMATWQFQKITPDGGVGLDFLEGQNPADLEQLREAIDEAIQEDEESRVASKQLSKNFAKTIRVSFAPGEKMKPLNIVFLVVGTRGDIQPFIGIALKMKEYGHRIRIASHKIFREFVESFGLEFYPIGGDPKVLSEFVVKHRGVFPGLAVKDALQQRNQVKEILYSTWGACTKPDPAHPDKEFRADAIVANPPAYGHIHCAEALNIPLHIVFTMPWTPTVAYPSPFARINTAVPKASKGITARAKEAMNWLSYFALEDLAWVGMADMIKNYRQKVLGLKHMNKFTASHALYHSKVPVTYIWSPSLVPRPRDWPSHVTVVGFVKLDLKNLTHYEPPQDLADFLDAGDPPIYIGFGSLVVADAEKLTKMFIKAIQHTGHRAIIQRGWGGLGEGLKKEELPEEVFLLESAPHDWLFPKCCAVVHHGGAGTTATGLYSGKPTFIVPFFGDQPFWGTACQETNVGPECCPIDNLTEDKIIMAFKELMMPKVIKAARHMAKAMDQEDGVTGAVDDIHATIYGCMNGTSPMIWMKGKKQVGTSTTIKMNHQADGTDNMVGEMRLARSVTTKNGAKSKGTAGAVRAVKSEPARAPAVVGADDMKPKSRFRSFLGC